MKIAEVIDRYFKRQSIKWQIRRLQRQSKNLLSNIGWIPCGQMDYYRDVALDWIKKSNEKLKEVEKLKKDLQELNK